MSAMLWVRTVVSELKAWEWFGILVSARGPLSRDPFLDFPIRPWVVERRSLDYIADSPLALTRDNHSSAYELDRHR